ncbi:hypothetical protein [Streptomyces sp. NPDC088757]|uniref:hypothetical protein n=1 Tax=Streptomyces sp. NPDC088757 TaxID=3365889 RepID=UPI0038279E60
MEMDARRREARARAARRVDADLARPQDEALPHLAVTVLATGAFAAVGFTLARMTDGWWWTGPFAAALATGAAAAGYVRKALRGADRRARRLGNRPGGRR